MTIVIDSVPVNGNLNASPLSLRKNFILMFAGSAIYAASSWGMLVLLAKIGTPEMVGRFTLGLAVTAPVIIFSNLSLRPIQVTDAQGERHFYEYLTLRLAMTGIAWLVIIIIILLSRYELELGLTILVIGLGKGIDSVSDIYYGGLQQIEQMNRIAVSLVLKGLLSLLFLAVAAYLTGSILWASVGWSLASLIVVLGYDIRGNTLILNKQTARSVNRRFWKLSKSDVRNLGGLAWIALPLGITTMLISLNANIPRYLVERLIGTTELGFFAAVSYVMTVGGTIINALGQSASPRLAKHYAHREIRTFSKLLLKLTAISSLIGTVGVLVAALGGRFILTILYRPEYAERSDVFLWLMIAAAISFVTSIGGYSITAVRLFKIQPLIQIAAIGSITLFCAVLIPKYGLLGTAWAMVISSCIQVVLIFACVIFACFVSKPQEALSMPSS